MFFPRFIYFINQIAQIKNNEEIGWFPWLSALRYKNDVIYLSFNIHIKELIFELKNGYTKYEFNYIGNMRSPYTIRLFELIKQYAKIGKRRLRVETLNF
ncbi:RepB family plasmid replication initiator protein [Pseudogracilibacillus auburnensis]|uniref:RepB family plasmid replication initiator protein n=1 Tax=Pseudogracilibacillus auburnensis TaxID=1494959 RepID=UPI000D76D58E